MKNVMKSIAFVAVIMMAAFGANAHETVVDRVAQLDDVYNLQMPASMVIGLGNLADIDILKATPFPTGLLKKVKSMQFVMASKKKVVRKAQKIIKELDDTRNYQVLFKSNHNDEERIAAYGYLTGYETFNEIVLVINENDRQLIVLQFLGDFTMDDINDIKDELRDDSSTPSPGPTSGNTTITATDDYETI